MSNAVSSGHPINTVVFSSIQVRRALMLEICGCADGWDVMYRYNPQEMLGSVTAIEFGWRSHFKESKLDELAGLCASISSVLLAVQGAGMCLTSAFPQDSLGSTVASEVGWRNCSYATPYNRLVGLGASQLIS